jgi:hypothetical protein
MILNVFGEDESFTNEKRTAHRHKLHWWVLLLEQKLLILPEHMDSNIVHWHLNGELRLSHKMLAKLNYSPPPDGQLKIILLLLEVRGYSDCFLSNIITPKQEVFYVNFATANIPAGGITGGIGSSFFFHESIPPLFVALMQFVACRI